MSFNQLIPHIQTLPQIFPKQFIQSIQQSIHHKQQFLFKLKTQQSQSQQPIRCSLSQSKLVYFKKILTIQPIQQTLLHLYTFMTNEQYSLQEKHSIINLVYKLLYLISEIHMNKLKLKLIIEENLFTLCKRFNHDQKSSISSTSINQYTAPLFTLVQMEVLLRYIEENILVYYQLWQKILNQNQQFTVTCKMYQPVQILSKEAALGEGKRLEVSEIINLEILKSYMGVLPPVEEKKEVKKK